MNVIEALPAHVRALERRTQEAETMLKAEKIKISQLEEQLKILHYEIQTVRRENQDLRGKMSCLESTSGKGGVDGGAF